MQNIQVRTYQYLYNRNAQKIRVDAINEPALNKKRNESYSQLQHNKMTCGIEDKVIFETRNTRSMNTISRLRIPQRHSKTIKKMPSHIPCAARRNFNPCPRVQVSRAAVNILDMPIFTPFLA